MRRRASATWVSSTGRALAGVTSRGVIASRPARHASTRSSSDHDLVTAFEVGWSVLYQDVSLFVADQLVSTLADLRVRRCRHPARPR